tara:strand:- start:107 stop:391 length:285 start_codon:yes stop_codon:yes gene_type:complete
VREAQVLLAMSALKVMMEQPHLLLVLAHLQSREAVAREAFGQQLLMEMMAVVVVVDVITVAQVVQELQAKGMTEVQVVPLLLIMVAVAVAVLER